MLDLNAFTVYTLDGTPYMSYEGKENSYYISATTRGFSLLIRHPNGNCNKCACSGLGTAIMVIEDTEQGREI